MGEKNISQVDLASKVGKPKATVNSWIKRGVIPDGEIVLSISELLGASYKYLIKGDDEGKSQIRLRFERWVDSMTDQEMETIENLFSALEKIGVGLKGQ